MTLQNIQLLYQEQLTKLYPISEIDSIFYLVAEKLLKLDKIHLKLAKDEALEEQQIQEFQKVLDGLKTSKPVQYILEEAWFYDLCLFVNEHVLIPRFETEELVQWILEISPKNEVKHILDIGTGSGCIPLALKYNLLQAKVFGMDVSEKALEVARKNGVKMGLKVEWILQDILKMDAWNKTTDLDIIVSNPPYIPLEEKNLMRSNVLDFEPHLALFVENNNPLIFYECITDFALKYLKKDGFLFFETNEFNAQRVKVMLEDRGFSKVVVRKDMSGKERMVLASR